jgi:purine-binding chemotaxis protein CheW
MEQQYLIARIAERHVAIPTMQVESVIDLGEVMPVPLSPLAVRGVVAIRSRVVTVIDTDVTLGLAPAPDDRRRAVITASDGHHYAMLVESLDEVETFAVQPLSSGVALGQGWKACARGIVEHAGEPMLVVDLTALIPSVAAAA